ncbi:hypothetical protein M885DRAFT_522247 [Pelagophyceae sp. CCMP2097]|nr:hypothetical protein M885DRAFT_522247 [Pelagophyceae sp. CCMP2097]
MDAALLGRIAGFAGAGAFGAAPASKRAPPPPPCARPAAAAARPRVRVVVFSKDRAFQLDGLLKSIEAHFVGADVDVVVLWTVAETSESVYLGVSARHPLVRFRREGASGSLGALLRDELSSCDFVMLAVDDALAFEAVDLGLCCACLNDHEDVLAVQTKLSPQISWSHSATRPSAPPRLSLRAGTPADLLFWPREEARGEWDYCWDLCCALYRGCDALAIVEACGAAADHPNSLEASGAALFAASKARGGAGDTAVEALARRRPCCACFSAPRLCVLAVNRVQSVHAAPTYACDFGDLDGHLGASTFDESFYASRRFDSVHIGDVVLLESKGVYIGDVALERGTLDVAYLIPALNAAGTVARSVLSALADCDDSGATYEVVVVDDGSTDGTVGIVKALGHARVRVVEAPAGAPRGVAAALNRGLATITAEFVARLDADDVTVVGRLRRQLRFLRASPRVQVVGAAALTFRNDDGGPEADRYVQHACDAGRVAWALHFSCDVTHPSVLARRGALGYAVAGGRAEDYDLWLRLAEADAAAVANLSDPLIWLRKSDASVSAVHRDAQRNDADRAAQRSFGRRIARPDGDAPPLAAVAALRRPAEASPAALGAAADLLVALEARFVSKLRDEAVCDSAVVCREESPTLRDAPGRTAASVREDVDHRLAELALAAMSLGADAATHPACVLWASRDQTSGGLTQALKALLSKK